MGVVTSLIPSSQHKYSKNPQDYWIHGIHYWPGEAVPYRKWNVLLPGYKGAAGARCQNTPPVMVDSEQVNLTVEEDRGRIRSGRSGSRSIVHHSSRTDWLRLQNIGLLCSQRHRTRRYNNNNKGSGSEVPGDKAETETVVSDKVSCRLLDGDKTVSDEQTTEIRQSSQGSSDLGDNLSTKSRTVLDSDCMRQPSCSSSTLPWDEEGKKSGSYPFENLVLSGGGMKGYTYIGAVKALEEAGVMSQFKRFAGASAGAMCCAALSVGYTAQEICTCFFVDLDEAFNDQSCPFICCVPKLYTRYGIHPAKKLLDGFGLVLGAKAGGNENITFKQHYEQFGKELCIVVCNLTKMTTEYCHYTTTPNWPIKEAVRMSISIPLMYEPARWTVDGQVNYFIDGSTGDHFPIHAFDGPSVGPNLKAPINPKTIGFYVLSEKDTEHLMWHNIFGKEIPNKPLYMPDTKLARGQLKEEIKRRTRQEKNFNKRMFMKQLEEFSRLSLQKLGMKHYEAPNKTHIKTTNVLDYILANLELLINAQVMCKLRPEDEERTIPINVGYIESNTFILEPPDREFMLQQGYASANTFLQEYREKHPSH